MIEVLFYSLNYEAYDNVDKTTTLGPFEYVQITYDLLRDHDGNEIAMLVKSTGDWLVISTGEHFSDVQISEVSS